MTVVYIINRIPTTALNNQISYEVLFEILVDFEGFKIFGCLEFSVNPAHKTDKFQPRGFPCIFLDYAPHLKGISLADLKRRSV